MDLFRYLKYGLAAILVFLGLKMIIEYVGHQFFGLEGHLVSPLMSLLIIVVILAAAVGASLKAGTGDKPEEATGHRPEEATGDRP
jgi:tellurite resistance protein TerC